MAWVLRGIRERIITTGYPRRPDDYGPGFMGSVTLIGGRLGHAGETPAPIESAEHHGDWSLCPTAAIEERADGITLDRGRCILCGRCVAARPDLFAFEPSPEVAALHRGALFVPDRPESDEETERLRAGLRARVRALRRSVHVRHVDAGSDGSEEWEVAALLNPVYDVQRLGIFFTASPRHADLLLVTGAGTEAMVGPLRTTYEAMPEPKIVLAAGTDATSGGLLRPSYALRDGVSSVLPVDVFVPGSPPSPFSLLHGILLAIGLLPGSGAR
ncbi:MAG: ferredoxin [Acidimicrobiales bacterium]|jgi:Ni,Fe-hydrogenase III small subunit/ferredoxin